MFVLTIQLPHDQRQIEVPASQRQRLLTDVLRSLRLPLNTRCGQRGLCNGCLVQLVHGCLDDAHGGGSVAAGDRLLRGCELRLPAAGEAEIHVPARSLLAHQPQVVSSFRLNVPRAHDPLWQAFTIRREDLAGDMPLSQSLLSAVAAQLDCGLPIQGDAGLGDVQPDESNGFHVVLEHRGDHRILHGPTIMEPGYGVAVDVGTTTVVVMLVELTLVAWLEMLRL